jgi:hypothetical protein
MTSFLYRSVLLGFPGILFAALAACGGGSGGQRRAPNGQLREHRDRRLYPVQHHQCALEHEAVGIPRAGKSIEEPLGCISREHDIRIDTVAFAC